MSMSSRGVTICRACDSTKLFSALDLGELPIANELLRSPGVTEVFPLHLRICKSCGLGQVADVVTPERLFRDYRYLSSVSKTFSAHAAAYVDEVMTKLEWKAGDWVLEIASNDGYLLKNFLKYEVEVLGIEPASNVAEIARGAGIPSISEFFSKELAESLLSKKGHPRLIIANNVYAHVPDIHDFTTGLSVLMNDRTLTSIENPSIMNLLDGMQFDSIYHEHYSYLSATSVSRVAKRSELSLVDVELIATHGGSNRYWLSKDESIMKNTVAELIQRELLGGLFDEKRWRFFSRNVHELIEAFREFCLDARKRSEIIAGYGAAAKASTLINAAQLGGGVIEFIVDESPEKVGRFMPNYSIPIVPQTTLVNSDVAHIVIFPWNLADEIGMKIRSALNEKVGIWCAIPELRRIA